MKGSVYMRWAKEHAAARYNLANSGMLGCSTEELEIAPGDVEINGANRDGYPPLLDMIAAKYAVAVENVVTAEGTSGANFLAFAALLDPGDEVLIEQPTYEPLLAALAFVGARVRRFSRRFENGFRPDLDELGSLLSNRTRLVVITSSHNPSGVFLGPEDLQEIGKLAARVGAWVLVDEVYQDLCAGEGAPASHVHLGPHFIATSSLTKSYGLSGLRCGWVLAAPELADRMRHAKDFMEAVNPIPSATLAVAAFRQLPRLAKRSRSILDPNIAQIRTFLAEHKEWLDCVMPERTMMVFPRLRREQDSEALHDWLRGRDTSIVPGKFFESPQFFRLGFAVRPEEVEAGLRHLSDGLLRSET